MALVNLVALILFSSLMPLLGRTGTAAAAAAVFILPLLYGKNTAALLLRMKAMLLTALMIFLFTIGSKGAWEALFSSLRFLVPVVMAALYVSSTDLLEMAGEAGALLSPVMGRTGWKLAALTMETIALIPIIMDASSEMLDARRSRGGSFLSRPLENLSEYTVSLMTILLGKTAVFQDALLSRSWSPSEDRTPPERGWREGAASCCVLAIFLGVLIWKKVF